MGNGAGTKQSGTRPVQRSGPTSADDSVNYYSNVTFMGATAQRQHKDGKEGTTVNTQLVLTIREKLYPDVGPDYRYRRDKLRLKHRARLERQKVAGVSTQRACFPTGRWLYVFREKGPKLELAQEVFVESPDSWYAKNKPSAASDPATRFKGSVKQNVSAMSAFPAFAYNLFSTNMLAGVPILVDTASKWWFFLSPVQLDKKAIRSLLKVKKTVRKYVMVSWQWDKRAKAGRTTVDVPEPYQWAEDIYLLEYSYALRRYQAFTTGRGLKGDEKTKFEVRTHQVLIASQIAELMGHIKGYNAQDGAMKTGKISLPKMPMKQTPAGPAGVSYEVDFDHLRLRDVMPSKVKVPISGDIDGWQLPFYCLERYRKRERELRLAVEQAVPPLRNWLFGRAHQIIDESIMRSPCLVGRDANGRELPVLRIPIQIAIEHWAKVLSELSLSPAGRATLLHVCRKKGVGKNADVTAKFRRLFPSYVVHQDSFDGTVTADYVLDDEWSRQLIALAAPVILRTMGPKATAQHVSNYHQRLGHPVHWFVRTGSSYTKRILKQPKFNKEKAADAAASEVPDSQKRLKELRSAETQLKADRSTARSAAYTDHRTKSDADAQAYQKKKYDAHLQRERVRVSVHVADETALGGKSFDEIMKTPEAAKFKKEVEAKLKGAMSKGDLANELEKQLTELNGSRPKSVTPQWEAKRRHLQNLYHEVDVKRHTAIKKQYQSATSKATAQLNKKIKEIDADFNRRERMAGTSYIRQRKLHVRITSNRAQKARLELQERLKQDARLFDQLSTGLTAVNLAMSVVDGFKRDWTVDAKSGKAALSTVQDLTELAYGCLALKGKAVGLQPWLKGSAKALSVVGGVVSLLLEHDEIVNSRNTGQLAGHTVLTASSSCVVVYGVIELGVGLGIVAKFGAVAALVGPIAIAAVALGVIGYLIVGVSEDAAKNPHAKVVKCFLWGSDSTVKYVNWWDLESKKADASLLAKAKAQLPGLDKQAKTVTKLVSNFSVESGRYPVAPKSKTKEIRVGIRPGYLTKQARMRVKLTGVTQRMERFEVVYRLEPSAKKEYKPAEALALKSGKLKKVIWQKDGSIWIPLPQQDIQITTCEVVLDFHGELAKGKTPKDIIQHTHEVGNKKAGDPMTVLDKPYVTFSVR